MSARFAIAFKAGNRKPMYLKLPTRAPDTGHEVTENEIAAMATFLAEDLQRLIDNPRRLRKIVERTVAQRFVEGLEPPT